MIKPCYSRRPRRNEWNLNDVLTTPWSVVKEDGRMNSGGHYRVLKSFLLVAFNSARDALTGPYLTQQPDRGYRLVNLFDLMHDCDISYALRCARRMHCSIGSRKHCRNAYSRENGRENVDVKVRYSLLRRAAPLLVYSYCNILLAGKERERERERGEFAQNFFYSYTLYTLHGEGSFGCINAIMNALKKAGFLVPRNEFSSWEPGS